MKIMGFRYKHTFENFIFNFHFPPRAPEISEVFYPNVESKEVYYGHQSGDWTGDWPKVFGVQPKSLDIGVLHRHPISGRPSHQIIGSWV